MLTKCPSCESLFDLPETAFSAKKFRCSTCGHVWENNINQHLHHHHLPEDTARWTIDWWVLIIALGALVAVMAAEFPRVSDYIKSWGDYFYMADVDPQKVLNVYEEPLQIHPNVVQNPSDKFDITDSGEQSEDESQDNPVRVD